MNESISLSEFSSPDSGLARFFEAVAFGFAKAFGFGAAFAFGAGFFAIAFAFYERRVSIY